MKVFMSLFVFLLFFYSCGVDEGEDYSYLCDEYSKFIVENDCLNNRSFECTKARIKLESGKCDKSVVSQKVLGCRESGIVNNLSEVSSNPLDYFLEQTVRYDKMGCFNFSADNPRPEECSEIEDIIIKGCPSYFDGEYNCKDPKIAIDYNYYCYNTSISREEMDDEFLDNAFKCDRYEEDIKKGCPVEWERIEAEIREWEEANREYRKNNEKPEKEELSIYRDVKKTEYEKLNLSE